MMVKYTYSALIPAGLLSIAFVFYVVSNALPSWTTVGNRSGYSNSIGLWRSCGTTPIISSCANINCPLPSDTISFCSKIQAAEAFVTLACLLSGIAAIGFVAFLTMSRSTSQNNTATLLLILKAMAIFCIVVGLIGVIIGINATTTVWNALDYSLGAGAILGIIAIIMNFFGVVAALFIRM